MNRWAGIISAIGLAALISPGLPGAAAAAQESTVVTIAPDSVETVIGVETVLTVHIDNQGAAPTGPLVAQLVVIDPAAGGSADAEDWTTELNRPVASIDPGGSRTIEWDVAPIMAGEYRVLVSVVALDGPATASSSQVRFTVTQPAVLVSGATLPVAIIVPLLAVVTALFARRLERRLALRPLAG